MIKSALIRDEVTLYVIRMCEQMKVRFPSRFPDEMDVLRVLERNLMQRDLSAAITECIMISFGAEPSQAKDPRFDKAHRAANKLLKGLRGGKGVEA